LRVAGEDEGPEQIWEAIDLLGVDRIGHGCSAVQDKALLRRMARDRILVECCVTSNYQTRAVAPGTMHPIFRFLECGVPVAVCTDSTTVSGTEQTRENRLLLEHLGGKEIADIHTEAAGHSFVRRSPLFTARGHHMPRLSSGPPGGSDPDRRARRGRIKDGAQGFQNSAGGQDPGPACGV
jgi:Adenosine deaminase